MYSVTRWKYLKFYLFFPAKLVPKPGLLEPQTPLLFHTAICFVLSKYLGLFFSLGYFLVAKFCVLKFLHGFHKVNSGSRLLFPVLLDMLFIHESTLVIAA